MTDAIRAGPPCLGRTDFVRCLCPQVYKDWAASSEQQLQPARQYLGGLGLDPDKTVAMLFQKGRHAQALLMPGEDFSALHLAFTHHNAV